MRAWIAAAVAAVAAFCLTGSAMAHDDVRRSFLPDGAGTTENPNINGRATLEYDECEQVTTLEFDLRNLVPNTTYGIIWLSDGPTLDNPAAFTTNNRGRAQYKDFQIGDASGDPVIILYINDSSSGDPFAYDAGEERAFSYLEAARIQDFEAAGDGATLNPCVDGKAKIDYHRDTQMTTFTLNVKDLEATTTYGVRYESEAGPTFDNPAAFTTNHHGKGQYEDFLVGLATRNVVITIYVNGAGADPFGFDPEEARAVGIAQDAH